MPPARQTQTVASVARKILTELLSHARLNLNQPKQVLLFAHFVVTMVPSVALAKQVDTAVDQLRVLLVKQVNIVLPAPPVVTIPVPLAPWVRTPVEQPHALLAEKESTTTSQHELLNLIALLAEKESTIVSQHKLLKLIAKMTATRGRTSTQTDLLVSCVHKVNIRFKMTNQVALLV